MVVVVVVVVVAAVVAVMVVEVVAVAVPVVVVVAVVVSDSCCSVICRIHYSNDCKSFKGRERAGWGGRSVAAGAELLQERCELGFQLFTQSTTTAY